MRTLDKTKIYDLSDLTIEEYEKLFKWLLGNDSGWRTVHFESWKNNNVGMNLKRFNDYWGMCSQKPTANAKELFYTLENVQVDCSNETEERINDICKVYESNGYKKWTDEDALKLIDDLMTICLDYNKTTKTVNK